MKELPINKDKLIEIYDDNITLSNMLCGNIMDRNVLTGFTRLDILAVISDADDADQVDNPEGTQRDLKEGRAKDALDYAVSNNETKFFPAIILNVRDSSVITLTNNGKEVEPEDIVENENYEIEINISRLEIPKQHKNPEISRVDGNHRLAGADFCMYYAVKDPDEKPVIKLDEEQQHDLDSLPNVQFIITIGLSKNEERQIFYDINHYQQGMNTNHIRTQQLLLKDDEEINKDINLFATKAADHLGKDEDSPFKDRMDFGGSRAGIKREGLELITTIAMMERSISATFKESAELTAYFNNLSDKSKIIENLKTIWNCYVKAFPTQFSEKGTLALKTVGMVALGTLAGKLISRERNRPGDIPRKISEESIMIYLDAINKANSTFWDDGAEKYKGIAGASAGKQIYIDLIQLLEDETDYINSRFAELA